MEMFMGLLILSIVVEGTIEYIKEWFVQGRINYKQICSAILGVFVAIAYNMDLLAMLGITSAIPYVGVVFTGIALSRGSNYLADLIHKLQNITVKE